MRSTVPRAVRLEPRSAWPSVRVWEVTEFVAGLAVGAGAAAVALAIGWIRTRRPVEVAPLPIAGLVVAAGGLSIAAFSTSVPVGVMLGVTGVAVTTAVTSRYRSFAVVAPAIALPFALLIAANVPSVVPTWVRVVVVATASLAGVAVARFDQIWRNEAPGPLLLAGTLVGVYLCVPDTEEIAALMGVALPLAVLGWPLRVLRLGEAGAGAAVAALSWVVAVGGRGRPASVLGAIACLGLLVGAPVGQAIAPRAGRRLAAWSRTTVLAAMVAGQAAIALFASRVAGLRREGGVAAVLAVVALVAALVLGSALPPDRDQLDRA